MKNLAIYLVWLTAASAVVAGTAATDYGQSRKRSSRGSEAKSKAETPAPSPSPSPEIKAANKRNERPAGINGAPASAGAEDPSDRTGYRYEFSQPDFINNRIVIEHDEAGKGMISFQRRGHDELFSDPLQVSPAALSRIKALLDALNFFDSTESYQYEKDYSHLGTASFKFKRNDKERAVSYNYTTRKEARELADEYRRLANQYIWMFDISVARENQPLSAPGLLDSLDSLFRRNEVSDKRQMLPILRELSNDERIPLIARNHAQRLIKQIERTKN